MAGLRVADALLFAARQLSADPVAMVFAARAEEGGETEFVAEGLPVLRVDGLAQDSARQLLDGLERHPPAPDVVDRLVSETRGNPLALLELPAGLSPDQRLRGRRRCRSSSPVTAGVERAFLERCRRLSEAVQTLLLVAAADSRPRGSLRAFATIRTTHIFPTTGVGRRTVRIAMSIFAM